MGNKDLLTAFAEADLIHSSLLILMFVSESEVVNMPTGVVLCSSLNRLIEGFGRDGVEQKSCRVITAGDGLFVRCNTNGIGDERRCFGEFILRESDGGNAL